MTVALSISCSKDEEASTEQIFGEWKLIRAEFHGLEEGNSSEESVDYLNQNITYDFRQNGLLKVTGGENAGYPTGEYEYFLGEDHFGCAWDRDDPKIPMVEINNSKWTYNFTNGKMKLGKSCVNGLNLVFEKK